LGLFSLCDALGITLATLLDIPIVRAMNSCDESTGFSTGDENLRLRAYDAAEPSASNRSVLLGTT
jgi:hypothetical protein